METKSRGMRAHPSRRAWKDVSDFVVHFTKDQGSITSGFQFVSILREMKLEARSKFGLGRDFQCCKTSVCFTETPIHELKRIAERRSPYSLGFHKHIIVSRGGGPVFYAYGAQGDAMRELMEATKQTPENPVWTVAPFVEQPNSEIGFEWEREWRISGNFNFKPSLVRFLTAPEAEHSSIKEFFAKEEQENGFPAYRCPLIDIAWDANKINKSLC